MLIFALSHSVKCEKSMAAAIYAQAVNAYNEIIEAVKSINSLTK